MVRRYWLAGAVAAVLAASAAGAQESQAAYRLSIGSAPMDAALNEFARQSGLQVVLETEEVKGLTAPKVEGTLTGNEALQRLLADSGLEFEWLNERTVAVRSVRRNVRQSRTSLAVHDTGNIRMAQADELQRAAPTDQSTSGNPAGTQQLEEVLVTAQKRSERLIDVPQSVSVLSAVDLGKRGATQFRDFADSVPGLSFMTAGAGRTQITLRGVTAGLDVSSTVGIYVDEVPYGSSTGFARGGNLALDIGLFDVDHIEVLRGPQGTLYGAATMGGLLKYVTHQPDPSNFESRVQAGVSSTEKGGTNYEAAGVVNIPLASDRVALRASAFKNHDDGYIDNLAKGRKDVNNADIYGGRLDLLANTTDALQLRITAFLQNVSQNGFSVADLTRSGVPIDGRLDQRHLVDEPFDQRFRLLSGTVSYDLGNTELTSISSYQTSDAGFTFDVSGSFAPLCPLVGATCGSVGVIDINSTDKFTQEVRWASKSWQTLDWQFGAFYTHETSSGVQNSSLFDVSGLPLDATVFTYRAPSQYDEYAAFGDLTWKITDRFDVTGGLRYGKNQQRVEQIATGLIGSRPLTHFSEGVFTYLANARYKLSERMTAYARYATGYRPGGPNFVVQDPSGQPIGSPSYDADRLKSYELGFRAESGDRRFAVDLAAYHIDWSNIIITVSRGAFSGRDNAPDGATITGQELSLTVRPLDALVLSVAAAHQRAKLSEDNTDLRLLKGQQLPNVPKVTAALNADYELPIDGLEASVGASYRFVDERLATFGEYPLPSYDVVDVRFGLTLGSLDTQFYVRNLLDERAELGQPLSSPAGRAVVSMSQPRTVGVRLTKSF